ncbi:MAG: putative tellurium resistance membrane protein TerC [Paracoccaceae bacterium]|jgi:predicted tellurium resistance membrane protein TerC
MADILNSLVTLGLLILLQAVLGFDNLLYISLESQRAPLEHQSRVRKLGIGIAVGLRIILLFVLINLVEALQDPFFTTVGGWVEGSFNFHSVIVLFGGAFILYTATKEIAHMMSLEDEEHAADRKPSSPKKVIGLIVFMNVIFSFDSILSAMALAGIKDPVTGAHVGYQMTIMIIAILTGGLIMILLADKVTDFLQRNRMYEVLGLFVLFVVGIMLLTEGAHLAHLKFFGNEIQAMTKTTFYFVIATLLLTDIVQGRYQKKLIAEKLRKAKHTTS